MTWDNKKFIPTFQQGLKGPAIYGVLALLKYLGVPFVELLMPELKISTKGFLKVRLFINGVWRYQWVDSNCPVNKKNDPLFSYSIGKEAWPFAIEKAYVKHYGTYRSYM